MCSTAYFKEEANIHFPMTKKLYYVFLFLIFVILNLQATKVIIDTDPGIDDSVAIMLAFKSPEIDVVGLTSVFGNNDIDVTTRNCLLLCEIAEKNIPVAKGAAEPLFIPKHPNPDFIHGKDGLGNTNWKTPSSLCIEESAENFIARQILENPHEVTIVALGPLTNLANALITHPEIAFKVKEVVIFAGAIAVTGNCTPVAEANVWGDPHAADLVFSAGWPLTTITLDASQKPQITSEILSRILEKNPSIGSFLFQINQFYIDFYLKKFPNLIGAKVHDALTISYLLNRELFKIEQGPIYVVTQGIAEGATILDKTKSPNYTNWSNRPSVNVCTDCDGDGILTLIEQRLSSP